MNRPPDAEMYVFLLIISSCSRWSYDLATASLSLLVLRDDRDTHSFACSSVVLTSSHRHFSHARTSSVVSSTRWTSLQKRVDETLSAVSSVHLWLRKVSRGVYMLWGTSLMVMVMCMSTSMLSYMTSSSLTLISGSSLVLFVLKNRLFSKFYLKSSLSLIFLILIPEFFDFIHDTLCNSFMFQNQHFTRFRRLQTFRIFLFDMKCTVAISLVKLWVLLRARPSKHISILTRTHSFQLTVSTYHNCRFTRTAFENDFVGSVPGSRPYSGAFSFFLLFDRDIWVEMLTEKNGKKIVYCKQ